MQDISCKLRKLTACDYAVSAWSGGTTTQLAIFPPEAKYADRDFLWRVSSATVELEKSDFTALPDYDRLIATLKGEITLTHNGGAPLTLQPYAVHAFSGADVTHSVGRCTDFNLMLRRGRAVGTMEALRLTEAPTCLNVGGSESVGDGSPVPLSHGSEAVGTSIACPQSSPAETVLLYCAEGECSAEVSTDRPQTASACSAGNLPAVPPAASHGATLCAATGSFPACHSERSVAESKNPSSPASLHAGETLLLTAPATLTLTGRGMLMLCRINTI